MKKGISPFIATILLIGFTVAVGAILSVWFTTFTRTQTTGITGAAECHAGILKIFSNATTTGSNALRVYVRNLRNDINVTVNSVVVACGTSTSSSASPIPFVVLGGQTNHTDVTGLSGCTISNTRIEVIGNCTTGGSFVANCPVGLCGVY